MADAAVEFLLENIKQLLLDQDRLIKDAKSQLQILEKDLSMFKALLEEHSTEKRNKNKALKELMRQIREVVYDAEDIIDAYVTQAAQNKTRNFFTRIVLGRAKLLSLSQNIEGIGQEVKRIYEKSRADFSTLHLGSLSGSDTGMEHKESKQIKVPRVREDNVVGFEGEAHTLITYFNEEQEELDVISIVGMPGLGKTTLARKVFLDPKVQYEFPIRIWIYISQEFTKRNVFLIILGNFINVEDEEEQRKLKSKTDDELAQIVCQFFENKKFLVVMDDIWTAEAWTDLEVAFPKLNTMGKILITSRNEEVARQANRNRDPHRPSLLTHEESWELLQLEVFGKPECHPDLEDIGKDIAEQCRGMPLAIVVIGGILVKKASTRDIIAMKNTWRKVSESLSTYLNEDTRMENIIALSYNKLPYYLRPCFLYIGMFPEDFEIPVWELINMWIAEGFIQQKRGISQEETAQDYFEELINRNLVMVDKVSLDGKIKTCRIHDMLRDFCQNEAGSEKENLFQEIKKSKGGDFEPSIIEIKKSRRLCIHSNVLSFISSKACGPQVRSFLCYPPNEILLPYQKKGSYILLPYQKKISYIPGTFELLRVLDLNPLMPHKFLNDLTKWVHLRHLALVGAFTIIPKAISKLWNLRTLIVYTICSTLKIEANIWKMIQLRHVKTNAIAMLPKPGKSTKECEKLQTLVMISPKNCTEDVFDRLRSLRKLGIRGELVNLDSKGLGKLDNLEKLKLVNVAFPHPRYECQMPRLLQQFKFPPKLRSLTISSTELDWSHMSTLAMLDNLEVLKLKYKAFVGNCWEAADGGFRHLEALHLERTDLITWKASAHHFPRLRCLKLKHCKKLEEIPSALVENLQRLDLEGLSQSVAASARKIEEAKRQQQGKETPGSCGFKLFIA